MADRYCSVRFKTGEELDKALAAALCSCDDAARAEAAAARAEEIQNKVNETVAEALTQAKESGEFNGEPGPAGPAGPTGPAGQDGKNGQDGLPGPAGPAGQDGEDGLPGPAGPAGQDGQDGKDGVSPVISVRSISGGHEVSVTDADGTKTFNVMDGKDGQNGSGGTTERPETVVLSEQVLTFGTTSSGNFSCTVTAESFMEAGVRTVVKWNDRLYICTAAEIPDRQDTVAGNLSMYNGGSNTGEPFYVVALSGDEPTLFIVADTAGPHTVRIYQGGSDALVSLPDSVPRIEDRASSMTFAETPEHHFDALSNSWWKVSDLIPTTEELMATVFTIVFSAGGNAVAWTPTAEELLLDSELFTGVQSATYGAGFFVCRVAGEHSVHFNGADFALNIPSAGIYFGYPVGTAVPESVSVSVAYTEMRKLDARLLPDDFEILVNHYIDEYLETALSGEY